MASTHSRSFQLNVAVLLLMAATLVGIGFILPRITFNENVQTWLPEDDPQSRMLSWQHEHFPGNESILVSWDGATLGDERLQAYSEALAESDWVLKINRPDRIIERMAENQVPEAEARRRLTGTILGSYREADPEQTPVGMLVTFAEADDNTVRDYVKEMRLKADAVGIPPETLHMGGGPYAAQELDRRLGLTRWDKSAPWYRPDLISPLALSALTSAVLAVLLLRRIRLTIAVLFITLLATCAGMALLPLTGRPVNMVLTVMPTLLMVLTLSAAIHVANYRRHAASLGQSRWDAANSSRKLAFWPCVLAAATTAIGLISLMTSSLKPVREFGGYSAAGVMIGLLAALYGLPAMMALLPIGRPSLPGKEAAFWKSLGAWVAQRGNAVSAVLLLITVVATAGLIWFRTETKVISYFPPSSSIVADYDFLEQHLGGLIPVDVIVAFDRESLGQDPSTTFRTRMEAVRRVEEALRAAPNMSGALGLPSFIARPQDLEGGQIAYNAGLRRTARNIAAGTDPDAAAFLTRATTPLIGENGRPLVQTGDEIWVISAQANMLDPVDFATLMDKLTKVSTEALGENADATPFVTGTVPLFLRTQQAVLTSLIVSFGLAFAVIAAVMIAVLRSVSAGLLAMVPNIAPVLAVFGVIAWFGQAVDIGMMITASVALGIAVDGTLHLLTWFRDAQAAGESRQQAIATALGHCGPAMWQTSGIVGLSLLMLGFADLLLISRFGWLMAALVGAALLADLFLLPAMLGTRIGKVFDRHPERHPMEEPTPSLRISGEPIGPHRRLKEEAGMPKEASVFQRRG